MPNLIIAGIGGQGINSLARVVAQLSQSTGNSCQYTVHKGGAQSLGTVYAEMRIVPDALPVLGSGIPQGKLDLLIAMDPWEALRHLPLAHAGTQCWVESDIMPLFTQRSSQSEQSESLDNPLDQLNNTPLVVHWQNYRAVATRNMGTPNMANFLAGLDCINALGIGDPLSYEKIFFNQVPRAKQYHRKTYS